MPLRQPSNLGRISNLTITDPASVPGFCFLGVAQLPPVAGGFQGLELESIPLLLAQANVVPNQI